MGAAHKARHNGTRINGCLPPPAHVCIKKMIACTYDTLDAIAYCYRVRQAHWRMSLPLS